MRTARWGRVTIATIVSLAACDQLFDIQERQALPADAGVDSSVDSGSEASDGAAVDGDAPAPGCTGPIVYVSTTTGSDSNPGCSSGAPKKTIGAAVALAKAAPTVTTIEVCKGVYNESPLVVTTATSLKGAFNCSTWARSNNYGYPNFDAGNLTVIQNADAVLSPVTLDLNGVAITSSVVVDGFTILGATSGTTSSAVVAVLVSNGASPTVSNNQLTGGGLSSPTGLASAGVFFVAGGNGTVTNNKINGGSGTVPPTSNENGHASAGVVTDGTSTSVQIVGNVISGGSGTAYNSQSDGSAGVVLLGPAAGTTDAGTGPSYTVRENSIVGGTGTSVGGAATVGLFAAGMLSLGVESNGIDGGGGSSGVRCTNGVYSSVTGSTSFVGNRIYGGTCAISGSGLSPVGLKINGAGSPPVIYDNMIHSGTTTSVPTDGLSALGLFGVTGADVRHNTLVAGPSGGPLAEGIFLGFQTSGTTIVNNILAGAGNDAGVLLVGCGSAGSHQIASLENNLIFGMTQGLVQGPACAGSVEYHTVDGLTAALLASQTGSTVQGNVTIASSCATDAGTDSGCVVSAGCTSPQTCLTSFFGGWDVTSSGYMDLFPSAGIFAGACPSSGLPPVGSGWTLATTPAPPCKVTQSSVNDTALTGLNVDLYGNCRSSTPTMGAEEATGVTCQ